MVSKPMQKKASNIERIIAFCIDQFVLSYISIMILYILVKIKGVTLYFADFKTVESTIYLTTILTLFLCFLKDFIKGMSVGKRVMKIQVSDTDDIQVVPNKWRLVLRNMSLVIWPIELLFLLVSKEHKRLGDI